MSPKARTARKKILRKNVRSEPKQYRDEDQSSESDESAASSSTRSGVMSENSDKFAAEKIVAKEYRWLIKWKGFPSENNTWEPKENLTECEEMLENFENKRKSGERIKDVENSSKEGKHKKVKKKDVYVVEKILDKQLWYLIKWEGYPDSDNQWEPEEHLLTCQDLIENYEKEQNYYKNQALGLTNGEVPKKPGRGRPPKCRDSISSEIRSPSGKKDKPSSFENREPHSILGFTYIGDDGRQFLFRWKDNSVGLVPAKAANLRWPQVVIAFYEKHIRFGPDD